MLGAAPLDRNGDRMTADYLNGCRAGIAERAPDGPAMSDYDRVHTLTYARLLDAERDGHDWTDVAAEVLDLDVAADPAGAKSCWQSHLDRAHWIVGEGLAAAIASDGENCGSRRR